MRKIAFGYSTRCNIRCRHCVASGQEMASRKMELDVAKKSITVLADSGVKGISFTAGEPCLYMEDLAEQLALCREKGIYTRVVTNSFWATSEAEAKEKVAFLRENGLCQLRLSYSRFHAEFVAQENVFHAAQACVDTGVDYFVSFVTDFEEEDDLHEQFLRKKDLCFYPEPMIYAGRAEQNDRTAIRTDYSDNRCFMNPYLAPDLSFYGCCDAGVHFTNTNFFYLGNLATASAEDLFAKSEQSPLFAAIRNIGLSRLALLLGMKPREIITFRKCELCKMIFDSHDNIEKLTYILNNQKDKLYR